MTTTENYGLNLPEENDFVDVNKINENTEKIDQALKDLDDSKASASGGDISDTVITSAEEPAAEYPVPAAGDSTKVFLGKTRKFFSDIKNWMTGVCMLGQIVNNCVTDNAKLPLSAAQGKALMDLYNVLNTKTSKTGHTHDDRYYTETEINSKLTGMATFQSINLTGIDEYVRFTNGYQICFGGISGRKSVTFGIAFSDPPIGGGFAPFGKTITYSNMSKTGVTLDASGDGLYIFMGRWK